MRYKEIYLTDFHYIIRYRLAELCSANVKDISHNTSILRSCDLTEENYDGGL